MNVFLIYKELQIENSYYDLLNRINKSDEKIILKFLNLFLQDKTYDNLILAYEQNQINNMYFYAHTLKGVALNLGFINLASYLNKLCIKIKSKNFSSIDKIINNIKIRYNQIINTINKELIIA